MKVLNQFVKLYEGSLGISQLKPSSNFEQFCFSQSTGLPIKLVSTKKHLDILPMEEKYYPFYESSPVFWMIPTQTASGLICGFILRSYFGKIIRQVFREDGPPPLWGFHSFKEYKRNNKIIITEGVRDALFAQRFYPYSLSMNTSHLGSVNFELIVSMTDKVILALDNDRTGIRMSKILTKNFFDRGVGVEVYTPVLKDLGEYFSHPGLDLVFKFFIKERINFK